jgi:hypothetical protein
MTWRVISHARLWLLLALITGTWVCRAAHSADHAELPLPVSGWRVVKRDSGPVNYYEIHKDESPPFIRAGYRPPLKTVVLGYQLPDNERNRVRRLHWNWRALILPSGGDECTKGKADSAAVVYVAWRRGLRWYSLKYVWSAVGTRGATCDVKRNLLVAQDTVILESGPPLNVWRREDIDLDVEFRKHFEQGDQKASVPDFMGVGLMTDGDQTQSPSAADYAEFAFSRR